MHSVSKKTSSEEAATSHAGTDSLSALGLNSLAIPIGSQTWPHRHRIKSGDFAGLCKDMAAIGIRSVEMCSPSHEDFASLADGKQVRKILDDHGLICPSGHFDMDILRTSQQEMIAWALDLGMTQMATATLDGPMQNGVTTMDVVKRAADEYNKIGFVAAKAGLEQVLHDEEFEMATVKEDGRLCYTVLLELLDAELIKMQFQMSAMRIIGDPVTYFTEYPGRFTSLHLQGVNPDTAPRMGGGVAVGKDSLDWSRIFAAAKKNGLKNYFVEQGWDLTVQSVNYLKTLEI